MSFQGLHLILALAVVAAGSLTTSGLAEDSLSLKVELRHGPIGPRRASPSVWPGDHLFFTTDINGLRKGEKGELKIKYQAELRTEQNDLLSILASRDVAVDGVLGNGKMSIQCDSALSPDYFVGNKLRLVCSVRDELSGKEVKQEYQVKICEPQGAYPIYVGFAQLDGNLPASGRYSVGDNVFVRFHLMGLTGVKKVNCHLAAIPTGTKEPTLDLHVPFDIPQVRNIDKGLPADLHFHASEPFSGIVRVIIIDDQGNKNAFELPLTVSEPLDTRGSENVAQKTPKSGEKRKKE